MGLGIFSHNVYENIRTRVIVLSHGQILLISTGSAREPAWRSPGGGLEPHESLAECARREILEETGIPVRVGRVAFLREWVVPKHTRPSELGGDYGYGLEVHLYAYPEEPLPEPRPEGPDEPLARWFPLREVVNLPVWPKELKDLCALLAEGKGAPAGILSFVGDLESPWARSDRNPFTEE